MGSKVGADVVGKYVGINDGPAVGAAVGGGEGFGVQGTVTLMPKVLKTVLTPSLALMFTA